MNYTFNKKKKEYRGDLRGKMFRGYILINYSFINCDLSGVSFGKSNLQSVVFEDCYSIEDSPPDFESAKLSSVTIRNCKFPNARFYDADINSGSTIENLILTGGQLGRCKFNDSTISDLHIENCHLNQASFIGSQIRSIHYRPIKRICPLRGLKLINGNNQQFRTIFINGNSHLEFADFCKLERRKDKLYSSIRGAKWIVYPISLLIVYLFGILTNYGTSFKRWFLCSALVILTFSVVAYFIRGFSSLKSIYVSIAAFFNFTANGVLPKEFLIETVIGYFMLAIMISLVTSKILE